MASTPGDPPKKTTLPAPPGLKGGVEPRWAVEVTRRFAFDWSCAPVDFGLREPWTATLREDGEEVASVQLGWHPHALQRSDFIEQCAQVSKAVGAVGMALSDESGRARRCLFTGLTELATAVIVIEEVRLHESPIEDELLSEFIENAVATVVGDRRAVVASLPVPQQEPEANEWHPTREFWEAAHFVHFKDGVFVAPQLRLLTADLEGRSVALELASWKRQVVWSMTTVDA